MIYCTFTEQYLWNNYFFSFVSSTIKTKMLLYMIVQIYQLFLNLLLLKNDLIKKFFVHQNYLNKVQNWLRETKTVVCFLLELWKISIFKINFQNFLLSQTLYWLLMVSNPGHLILENYKKKLFRVNNWFIAHPVWAIHGVKSRPFDLASLKNLERVIMLQTFFPRG